MVDKKSVEKQLKDLDFNHKGWGRTEVNELHNILLPDEKIYEVVNGIYDGGFALLVGTDVRVLLVDKKPLNYLTVEDLRFDMINEIDYSHRLIGAHINIATGNKNLKFTTLNQQRLRTLIGHVQNCMADTKRKQSSHAEDQKTHLKEISEQLQTYLAAQQKYNERVQEVQQAKQAGEPAPPLPEKPKPSHELSDFLFAQSLMAQYDGKPPLDGPAQGQFMAATVTAPPAPPVQSDQAQAIAPTPLPQPQAEPQQPVAQDGHNISDPETQELYNEGVKEIFGNRLANLPMPNLHNLPNPMELNPMKIAYSKLPMALRNRKFGSPSFHAHSAAQQPPQRPELEPVS
jgi:Bacterial PH domain